jgi:chromatin remodeling complex protein RSC6
MAKAKTVSESKPEKTPRTRKPKASSSPLEADKKSSIPAIKRPRSINQMTFVEYIDSTMVNLEYRLSELDALHAEGKCPHKAIQHLKSLQKEFQYLSKRITPLIKHPRKQVDKTNNVLMKQVTVSPALAKFLHLGKNEQVSRSECNTAVTMYINVKNLEDVSPEKQKWLKRMNPKGERCLQSPDNGSIIVPDKALSDLLNYPAYQKRVAAGKHYWHRKNKETGVYEDIQETDDRLTYSVIQHLLAPHFKSDQPASAPTPAATTKAARGRKAASVPVPVVADTEDASEAASDEE